MASRSQLRRQAEYRATCWNSSAPIGTPVVVLQPQQDGSHQRTHTCTTGPATAHGHTVVVPCRGFGDVPIERIERHTQRVAVITPEGATGVVETPLTLDSVTLQLAAFFGAGTQVAGVSHV